EVVSAESRGRSYRSDDRQTLDAGRGWLHHIFLGVDMISRIGLIVVVHRIACDVKVNRTLIRSRRSPGETPRTGTGLTVLYELDRATGGAVAGEAPGHIVATKDEQTGARLIRKPSSLAC